MHTSEPRTKYKEKPAGVISLLKKTQINIIMSNNTKQANYVTKKTGICIKNKRRNINLRYCYNEDLPRRSSFTNYLQNLRNDNKQKRNRTKNNKDGNILLERYGKIHRLCKNNISSPPRAVMRWQAHDSARHRRA